jgi:hypothetical protein
MSEYSSTKSYTETNSSMSLQQNRKVESFDFLNRVINNQSLLRKKGKHDLFIHSFIDEFIQCHDAIPFTIFPHCTQP